MWRLLRILVVTGALAGCAGTTANNEPVDIDKRVRIHVDLGLSYMQRNQLRIAREELTTALKLDPASAPANHSMALLSERLDETAAAGKYYAAAVRSAPDNGAYATDYGNYLCRQNSYAEAGEQFNAALNNPLLVDRVLTLVYYGACKLRQGDYSQAETLFRQALEINPANSAALLNMAEIKYHQKNMLSTRAYLERFFSFSAPTPRSLWMAYEVETALDDEVTASIYASELAAKFPNSNEAKRIKP